VGQITLTDAPETLPSIPGGHYTVNNLVKELKSNLEQNNNKTNIKFETNNSNSLLRITTKKKVSLSHGLAALLGTRTRLDFTSNVRKPNTPSTYFIPCDLDRTKNFFLMERGQTFWLHLT